jgi:anti-sigma factor RsiW
MNCDEFVELVTAYLDGALDPVTEQRFVEHLAACTGCDRYLDQIRTTVTELGHLATEDLAPEARELVLAAFRNWHDA